MPAHRKDQVRRVRGRTEETKLEPRQSKAVMPPPGQGWHAMATAWYESLNDSLQSEYFEPSDWMMAQILAENLSRLLRRDKPSGVMLNTLLTQMNELGTTMNGRQKVGITSAGDTLAELSIDEMWKALDDEQANI